MTQRNAALMQNFKSEPRSGGPRDRDLAAVTLQDPLAMPPVFGVFNLLMHDLDDQDTCGLALGLLYHAQMIARTSHEPVLSLRSGAVLSLLGMAYVQESARITQGFGIAGFLQEWWDERARVRSDKALLKALSALDNEVGLTTVTSSQWQQALFMSEGVLREVPPIIRAQIYKMQADMMSLLCTGTVADMPSKRSDNHMEHARAMRALRDMRGQQAMDMLARHPHVRWDPDSNVFMRRFVWQGL